MRTMNISLPEPMKAFVDAQVVHHGYGTRSEYMRALIGKEQDRLQRRALLRAGTAPGPATPLDANYVDRLHARVRPPAVSGCASTRLARGA